MRIGALILLVVVVLGVAPAGAATLLPEEELDRVSAGGFVISTPFVAPVVFAVPITLVNVPVNVNTIVNTNVSINPAIGVCGFCPGGSGPTATSTNPLNNIVTVDIPQVNTFTPSLNFSPSVNIGTRPPFFFPAVNTPTVTVPQVSVPTVKLP